MELHGAANSSRIGSGHTLVIGFDLTEPRATGQNTVVRDDGLVSITELVAAYQCRTAIQDADSCAFCNIERAIGLQFIKTRQHRLTRPEAAAGFRRSLNRR